MEITPRTNTKLFGHEDAEALLMHDFAGGKLAHGWIISGPKGIGKATLAYQFAKALLSQEAGGQRLDVKKDANLRPLTSDLGDATSRRVAANSHADLLVVEPIYDEKKEEHASDISVEQAREIAKFLSLTPGEGAWRVVIVDSADALNVNAANSILKILEEPPPQSVILLIAHNPGKLLPTIRSRCQTLKLKSLSNKQFSAAMRHITSAIEPDELAVLAQLSAHAPGVALELHEQGAVEIYNEMLELLSPLPQIDTQKLHAFADRMTTGQQHRNWQILTRLMLHFFERAAKLEYESIPSNEAEVLQKAAVLHPAALWAAKWQQCADQFSLAQARHLDYKQVIITFFHSIASREVLVASGEW